ncbi:MAG: methylenetetrahydrofolate reductase [Desulfovibrionaceae bacterium]
MNVPDIIRKKKSPFLSLEFFPPKERSAWPEFFEVASRLQALHPLFCSVTYGAGGGTQDNTLEIASKLQSELKFTPLTHLTSVGATRRNIEAFITRLQEAGLTNVLALRGDPPRGVENFDFSRQEFTHATDLLLLLEQQFPGICAGAAGYPTLHPESPSAKDDLAWTKYKVECGAKFIVTQLFFDNRAYFDFVDRLAAMGVDVPVIPGVLPILTMHSLKFILSLCGAPIPGKFFLELEEAHQRGGESEVRKMGLEFTKIQARGLMEGGAPGVHLYTLNKDDACLEIGRDLGF